MPKVKYPTAYPKPVSSRPKIFQSKLSNEDLSRALNYVLCVTVPFCCAMTGYVIYVLLAPNICDDYKDIKKSDLEIYRECLMYECSIVYIFTQGNVCADLLDAKSEISKGLMHKVKILDEKIMELLKDDDDDDEDY